MGIVRASARQGRMWPSTQDRRGRWDRQRESGATPRLLRGCVRRGEVRRYPRAMRKAGVLPWNCRCTAAAAPRAQRRGPRAEHRRRVWRIAVRRRWRAPGPPTTARWLRTPAAQDMARQRMPRANFAACAGHAVRSNRPPPGTSRARGDRARAAESARILSGTDTTARCRRANIRPSRQVDALRVRTGRASGKAAGSSDFFNLRTA